MNLVEVLKPRAMWIAEHGAQRLSKMGEDPLEWGGYHKSEGMKGLLVREDFVIYQRPNRSAYIFFGKIKITEVDHFKYSAPETVDEGHVDRIADKISNDGSEPLVETIKEEFQEVATEQNTLGVSLEEMIKVGLSGGVEGIVDVNMEVSVTAKQEYQRVWGNSRTRTNSVERVVTVPPHSILYYEARRSRAKMKKKITGRCRFSHEIHMNSDWIGRRAEKGNHWHLGMWEPHHYGHKPPPLLKISHSYADYLSVVKGQGDTGKEWYWAFQEFPAQEGEIRELEDATEGTLEHEMTYNDVTSMEIVVSEDPIEDSDLS